MGPDHTSVSYELSGESMCAYVPVSLREAVFEMFHKPAHLSSKITDRTVRQRYVWPDMHRDIARWCKQCIACQQSKVARHVKRVPEHFVAPDGRFDQIHIDIIGPLPISNGLNYCLTMIDRFSRWVEAVPLVETSAQTIDRVFSNSWISRYGAPKIITTDQGAQFESRFNSNIHRAIEFNRLRTNSHHPISSRV